MPFALAEDFRMGIQALLQPSRSLPGRADDKNNLFIEYLDQAFVSFLVFLHVAVL